MRIRQYNQSDYDNMMKLHREVLIKENAYRGSGIWESDLHDIAGYYLNFNGEFLVGLLSNEIVAMGGLRKIDDDTAEIVRMRVHPDHQGRGFGDQILHDLEKFAARNNYKYLVLETDERLTNAAKLYRKNGYNYWKKEIIDGYKCIWYKKTLNNITIQNM